MVVKDFRTWVVANPPPHFGGRYFVLVVLETDSGVTGVGEVYTASFGPHTVARMIADVCEREVIGADPFDIETLWRRVYGRGYTLRPDVSLGAVLSGVEMALWDIAGKETGQPVYKLLGGKVHERLRSYTYIYPGDGDGDGDDAATLYRDPDRSAERAAEYARRGFTALKFDPLAGYSVLDPGQPSGAVLERCERFLARLREAVGGEVDLLFGTHGQLTPAGALRLARRIEPYDPLWLEEPVPPEMPEAMATVARGTSIPVATGERLTTKYEFARVLDTGAAAILQPNLARVGGLLEARKIAGMAETRYAQIAPHLYCGPVAGAANIQLATCTPNFLILEGIEDWTGFHARLLKTPVRWEDGYVIPPEAPGLGVELDEVVAAAHPYTEDALHLEMSPRRVD